jgi:hypothetical protein
LTVGKKFSKNKMLVKVGLNLFPMLILMQGINILAKLFDSNDFPISF